MNDESKKKDTSAEKPTTAGVKTKTKVRAGALTVNHNKKSGVKVKTAIKAGDDWEARV
jgi:hypothetical protein